jgi:transglutaminase superfamily protein
MMRLLGSALVTVARIRMALWMLPWRSLARSVTIRRDTTSQPPSPERLEWIVRVVSRVVPHATCLTQAVALQRLLARHGYSAVMQVGACNLDGRFVAHAWVEHEGRLLLSTRDDVARYARFFTWPDTHLNQP